MKSRLNSSLSTLGYRDSSSQLALIENMYISGLFDQAKIEECMKMLFPLNWQIKYNSMIRVLTDAHVYEGKFNPGYIINNISDWDFNNQDIRDILLYLTQFAFNRDTAQERNSILKKPWMYDAEAVQKYIKNARLTGLLDEQLPKVNYYHETWIMGSSYKIQKERFEFLKQQKVSNSTYFGLIRCLSGQRELSIEFDSKEYILDLARRLNVKYDQDQPFIKSANGMTHLSSQPKLYETDMVEDIYFTCFHMNLSEHNLIDSAKVNSKSRPDTAQTVRDAVNLLIERVNDSCIKSNKVNVLIVSSQPFITQQLLVTQKIVDQAVKYSNLKIEVNIHPSGLSVSDKQATKYISIVHSDGMGASNSERYKSYAYSKRDINTMLYQPRSLIKKSIDNLASVFSYTTPLWMLTEVLTCIKMAQQNREYKDYLSAIALTTTAFLGCSVAIYAVHTGAQSLKLTANLIRKEGIVNFGYRVKNCIGESNTSFVSRIVDESNEQIPSRAN